MYDKLQDQNIIDKNMKFVDSVTEVETVLFILKNTFYIYQNDNDNYIAIKYTKTGHKKNEKCDYKIYIYHNVKVRNDIKLLDSGDIGNMEKYSIYKNGKYTYENKYYNESSNEIYSLKNSNEYCVINNNIIETK